MKKIILSLICLFSYSLHSSGQSVQAIYKHDPADLIEFRIESLTKAKKKLFKPTADFVVTLEQLSDTNVKIVMTIGKNEAVELAIAIEEMKSARPSPGELLKTVISELGFTVSKIIIDAIKDEIFHAKMILTKGNETKTIDCRPADALTQAVRFNCGIFIAKSVVATSKM